MTVRRVLCVWLPTFSTDLAKLRRVHRDEHARGERPGVVLLTKAVSGREVVVRRCAAAAKAGVEPGMDLAHARSLLPARLAPAVEPHRPERDAAALHRLAANALRYSPVVAADPPDGLFIDVTGTERLHGSERRLVTLVAARFERLGFGARIAAASTCGCAWAVAHFGKHALCGVPHGCERDGLRDLPVAALRIDGRTEEELREVGLETVGHVLNLPRASLAARFDPSLLRRLSQALGEIDERQEPVRPAPPIRRAIVFNGATDNWESIHAAAEELLAAVVKDLEARDLGVRRLVLSLREEGGGAVAASLQLSRPTRSFKHVWTLLRTRLERLCVRGGVEGVEITAARIARIKHEQCASSSLGGDGRSDERMAGELTDTLASRLGPDSVVCIDPVASHLPERAFRTRSALEAPLRVSAGSVPHGRPTVLYRRPEPARVVSLTPDGPILGLAWRGERAEVVACEGPERIEQEWWRWDPPGGGRPRRTASNDRRRPPPPARDYYAVQTRSGRWLWVCRQVGGERWFVHGEWC